MTNSGIGFWLLGLALTLAGSSHSEEMVTIPKDPRIGPKGSEGVRECFQGLNGTKEDFLMNPYYWMGEKKKEPVIMLYDLGEDDNKMLRGYHLISERGTLYFPHPKTPNYKQEGTPSSVTYVELARVHGFSSAADRDYFEERLPFMRYSIVEAPKGARQYYDQGDPSCRGPRLSTSEDWRSRTELQKVEAGTIPEGRSAEKLLVAHLNVGSTNGSMVF